MEGHSGDILGITISTDGNLIVSGSYASMLRWDARTGEQIGDGIQVPGRAENITLSNDRGTIACGSPYGNYVQKWDAMTGEPICEPMKWSDGERMLDGMERARLCGDQECDTVSRKDTFPIEISCRNVCRYKKKIVLGLRN